MGFQEFDVVIHKRFFWPRGPNDQQEKLVYIDTKNVCEKNCLKIYFEITTYGKDAGKNQQR